MITESGKYHWQHSPYQVKTTTFTAPIPLSKDLVVTVANLPVELNKEQAEKICAVVMALVV